MLNRAVALNFSNDQYQALLPGGGYKVVTECSIAFELDGPYRCILLPAAKEKDKKLKKRYAVFHMSGALAEMKGFEIKRRGELKLVKVFQSEVFSQFLNGTTLEECYQSVAATADRWLDVLDTQGVKLEDEELLELLTESSNMSKRLEAYGTHKTAQVTTARRLAEFLGDQIVKSEGLKCAYVVANKPYGAMVTERAVPTAIFLTDASTRRRFLTKWLKFYGSDDELTLRQILDWDYYWKRLESTIQKIVTIPAGIQGIFNPVPRIKNPDWLEKQIRSSSYHRRQLTLDTMLSDDIEDVVPDTSAKRPLEESTDETQPPLPLLSMMAVNDEGHQEPPSIPKGKKQKKEKKSAKQSKLDKALVPMKDHPTGRVDTFFRRQVQDFVGKAW
jgi:DNA polymerase epsilon subunit 1